VNFTFLAVCSTYAV
jgi:hypothetical protein